MNVKTNYLHLLRDIMNGLVLIIGKVDRYEYIPSYDHELSIYRELIQV